MTHPTPGSRFRAAVEAEVPLQIAGTINAYSALLARRAGFRAVYLSGAGVAGPVPVASRASLHGQWQRTQWEEPIGVACLELRARADSPAYPLIVWRSGSM